MRCFIPTDDIDTAAIRSDIQSTVSTFLDIVYIRVRGRDDLIGGLIDQSVPLRTIEHAVLGLQRTIDTRLRFDERQHLAVLPTRERTHLTVIPNRMTHVV